MRTRVLALLWAALATPLLLASNCNTGAATLFQFFAPAAVVTDFDVRVQLQIPAGSTFDPTSGVTLNGAVIQVTQDAPGSGVYSAYLSPGFPLKDDNLLEAHATRKSGAIVTGTQAFTYAPPKALPRQTRPVTSWKGRVAISSPAPATPITIDSPQPRWQHSRACRINLTLPTHSKE